MLSQKAKNGGDLPRSFEMSACFLHPKMALHSTRELRRVEYGPKRSIIAFRAVTGVRVVFSCGVCLFGRHFQCARVGYR